MGGLRSGLMLVSAFSWALALSPDIGAAGIITLPTDLSPGAQYRLVFVTSASHDAQSSDIAVYNSFVQGVANGSAELQALGTVWKAIASTPSVAARDNTGTDWTPPGDTGVPIYRLDATRIADHYDDLWDGSILAPININENGGTHPSVTPHLWSGTNIDGAGVPGYELGTTVHPEPAVGFANDYYTYTSPSGWIYGSTDKPYYSYPLYAISGLLTAPGAAIPEPSTLAVWSLLGGLGITVGWWRRRRTAG